ncbi:hypothetical protein MTO96_025099 [Rhipicephalus appendiculatus]
MAATAVSELDRNGATDGTEVTASSKTAAGLESQRACRGKRGRGVRLLSATESARYARDSEAPLERTGSESRPASSAARTGNVRALSGVVRGAPD